ncbi:hypothetical protein EMN47_09745 [Prolixibacteraceae bacterium JC049]|nr:hypothetical protein [Prolixibacteraceae bacterium JC049]
MKLLLISICMIFSFSVVAQSKSQYLKKHRENLRETNFEFSPNNFKIIGFGALHGSSKTYQAEFILIERLIQQNRLNYYIPETNFCQAHFFNKYLKTGDEKLLRKLVLAFQSIVMQEGTIDTYEHWKRLKRLNDNLPFNKKIKVIGFDVINEYEFPIKHILELTKEVKNWEERDKLKKLLTNTTLSLSPGDSITENKLKEFANSYKLNKEKLIKNSNNIQSLNHIITNIEYNFQTKREREKIIYRNFSILSKRYKLKSEKLFFKYGYFHLHKAREHNYPSFFTRLIEKQDYTKQEVITVMGYLTKSKVLWDKLYDQSGNYKSYTIEKGYGISDYWKEYFKGIRKLKKNKLSDLTLFQLSSENSPYNSDTDLIELKMLFKDYNTTALKGKHTTQFIDYAILISNSEEQVPIEELK